jgi:hypothetical protein
MAAQPKHGKEQLEERREILRSLLARGINKPGRILKTKAIKGYYEGYKHKYATVKKDIEAVRKEYNEMSQLVNEDIARGDLMMQYEETLQKAWSDLAGLEGRAKVTMMKFIHELNKDIARLNGIDPERIDPKHFQLNVENDNSIRGPVELVIDSEDFMKRELEFAERLIKQRRGNVGGE